MVRETAEERAARLERDKQREAMRKQREKDNRLKQAGRRTQAEREAELAELEAETGKEAPEVPVIEEKKDSNEEA